MKLISDFLFWLIGKLTLVVFLVLLLTILFFAKDTVGSFIVVQGRMVVNWLTGKDKIELIQVLEGEVQQLQNQRVDIDGKLNRLKNYIDQLEERVRAECDTPPPWYKVTERFVADKNCEIRKVLLDTQTEFRNTQISYNSIIAEIEGKMLQIGQWQDKPLGALKILWASFSTNVTRISLFIILVLVGPVAGKFGWYHTIARFAGKARPIQIASPDADGELHVSLPQEAPIVTVDKNNPLYLRESDKGRSDNNLICKEKRFWKNTAPFISYSAGLFRLLHFKVKGDNEKGTVALAPKAGRYVTELYLIEHPGVVIHPHYIVGISGNIQVKAKWIVRYIHSWLTGQHRYIIFYGTGKIYLAANGKIAAAEAHETAGTSIQNDTVVGFDTRLSYSTIRTDPFGPYFRNNAPLITEQFKGAGMFLRHTGGQNQKAQTAIERNFQFLSTALNVIAKFFGF
jgi:hypothetical protein